MPRNVFAIHSTDTQKIRVFGNVKKLHEYIMEKYKGTQMLICGKLGCYKEARDQERNITNISYDVFNKMVKKEDYIYIEVKEKVYMQDFNVHANKSYTLHINKDKI